ncbi:MAG: nucleotidyltransferase domain-containing protein [Candidatus Methanoperedens sp.]
MKDTEYFTRRCIEEFGENLVSVVLFGSTSRGFATKRSDVDFIIVLNQNVEEEIVKNLRLDFIMKFGKKIDTVCLNRNDALDNFERISPLFATLVLGIKILYDKDGFFEKEFKKFTQRISETRIKYYEGNKLWDIQKICTGILH